VQCCLIAFLPGLLTLAVLVVVLHIADAIDKICHRRLPPLCCSVWRWQAM
jgi:hypothetical protein